MNNFLGGVKVRETVVKKTTRTSTKTRETEYPRGTKEPKTPTRHDHAIDQLAARVQSGLQIPETPRTVCIEAILLSPSPTRVSSAQTVTPPTPLPSPTNTVLLLAPRSPSPPQPWGLNSDDDDDFDGLFYYIPHPSELKPPQLSTTGLGKYYVVFRGQQVGIFGTW